MNHRRVCIWLLAVALLSAAVPLAVSAAPGDGGPPADPGARGGGTTGGPSGNATDDGAPGEGRGHGNGNQDIRAQHQQERREFFRNQSQERAEFMRQQAQARGNASGNASGDAHDAAAGDGLNASERERIRAEREAFLAEQRAEREAFLAEQRAEQRAVEMALRDAWESRRPSDAPTPERLGRFAVAQGGPGAGAAAGAANLTGAGEGRYVTFNYDLAPAATRDVRVAGQLVFDRLALGGNATSAASLTGAVFSLKGADGAVVVHDNPAAVIRVHPTGGAGFALDMADYLAVEGNGTTWNVSDGAGLTARLDFARAPAFDAVNRTFTGHGAARFVAFALQPHLNASNAHRSAIHDAIGARDVGAEVTLVDAGGEVAEETILYDDLNVSVVESEEGRVRLQVDGHGDTGKTVVVNVDAALFQGDALRVRYFDVDANATVEVPIVEASSLDDVLDPNDDSTPEYWVVEDASGVQVLVTVPHFSVHEVEIQSLSLATPPPPTVVAGVLGAVLFVAVATTHMFRRPDA